MAGIKIQIDGENRSALAVNQAQQGVQRLTEQVKQLSQQTAASNTKAQEFSKGLQEVARQAIPATGNLGRLTQSLASFNVGAGLAVAAVAAVGAALVSAARGIADYQESMDIASRTTGLTTGQLAGLKVAASESGRSFEQLRPSLDFFTRKIGEAADGSKEAQKAFNDLGVATKVGDKIRATGDILRDVQVALNGISDPAVRAQKAFDLFGRGAAASMEALLTPIDAATERAQKLGVALGPDAEKVARQADKAFDSLKTSIEGIGNAFGVVAAKILNPFLTNLARAATEIAKLANDPSTSKAVSMFSAAKGSNPFVGAFSAVPNIPTFPVSVAPRGPIGPLAPSGITDAINKEIEARKALAADLDAERRRIANEARFQSQFGLLDEGGRPFRPTLKPMPDWMLSQLGEKGGMTPGGQIDTPALTKDIEKTKDDLLDLAHSLKNALADAITNAIFHAKDLEDAFAQIGKTILETGIQKGVNKLLDVIFPFQMGGTLAMQSGGTVAFDSFHPIRAQSGLVVQGIRGVDSVPALLGRGETVLDHSLTDSLRSLIPRLDKMAGNGFSGSESRGSTTINIHISGDSSGRSNQREWIRKELLPEIRDALSTGSHR